MKLKIFFTLLSLVFLAQLGYSQDRFVTRSGHVKFFSSAPLEDIEAHSNKVSSILDLKKNEVVVSMLIKTFEFEKKLMQEHFNENYMESDKYPKSTFSGSFEGNSDLSALKDGTYTVNASGEISIHGVSKQIETPVTLTVSNGKVKADFVFMAKVKEFGIKIPKVVVRNIAEEVEVTAAFEYEPYK